MDELWILKGAVWPEQMPDLDCQSVSCFVADRELPERGQKVEPVLQIGGALPGRVRKGEVRNRGHRPWSLDHIPGFRKECPPQAIQRIRLPGTDLQHAVKDARLLGGGAHALAVDRIEAADCIANGKQSVREGIQLLK